MILCRPFYAWLAGISRNRFSISLWKQFALLTGCRGGMQFSLIRGAVVGGTAQRHRRDIANQLTLGYQRITVVVTDFRR